MPSSFNPLGFLPLIEPKIVDYSGTAGVRGVLGEKWFWDLSAQYFCGIDNTLAATDQTFSAKWLFDVDLSYQLGHVGFGAGVANIFDTFPDRAIAANNNFGIFTYPRNSPFGFNGRYAYLRTSYVF